MQIEHRPSRGPYVAALICLLALCLTIPLYWQSGAERARKRKAALAAEAAQERPAASRAGIPVRSDRLPYSSARFPNYGEVDTLDEILYQLANRPGGITSDQPDLFMELLGAPESNAMDPAESQSGVVWQYVRAALHKVGRKSADYSLAHRLVAIVAGSAFSERPGANGPDSLPTASLTFTSSRDRLALLPGRESRLSQLMADAFPTPWCVPVVLIERLEVLVGHPYSAIWAQQTIDELRALTKNGRPSTEEVAGQLERIHTLAAEAIELADATDDECLRAELLRAHWGLTRRLECWMLMRDIAVASVSENRFAAREPWDGTKSVLAGQATPPVNLQSLSGDLEEYECSRTPRLARAIVQRQRLLAQSNDVRQRELASQIEQNYRNANVRLALSSELLERFVPEQQSEMNPVRDRIAGTPVRGRSITNSASSVNLHPNSTRWQVDLESTGTVDSQTVADGGQAEVCTRGTTTFTAQKSLLVKRDGVYLGPTSVDAQNHSRLVDIRSDFDWLPVVGSMIRNRAADEYRKKQQWAQAEVEYKVACRVEEQLDGRARQAVDKIEKQMREQLSEPLASVGVEVTPIELSTTAERVIARLRIAGQDQLAGHTPRPRAPSDSLASAQVHESALTNAAVSLELNGKRLTAQELQTLMREKFSRSDQPTLTLVDADTVFEFASTDAVRFRVADERLELILSLREVDHEGSPVINFRVHAFYVPVIRGLEAKLVRDGALGIEGRIRTGERARMHGVFNKVLSEERQLPIVRLNDPNDQRLTGLMITQLVLEDGWIGLAIGPGYENRTAERTRTLR